MILSPYLTDKPQMAMWAHSIPAVMTIWHRLDVFDRIKMGICGCCVADNTASVRVNSVFGEGVSPRLRKVRLGLAALGWPSSELLKHGRERIIYGVNLVENLRDYSLGIDDDPRYLLDLQQTDESTVAYWWLERWGKRRADQEAVRVAMRSHSLAHPIHHGARVVVPLEMDAFASEVPASKGGESPTAQGSA